MSSETTSLATAEPAPSDGSFFSCESANARSRAFRLAAKARKLRDTFHVTIWRRLGKHFKAPPTTSSPQLGQ
jgi:hypothetical protein